MPNSKNSKNKKLHSKNKIAEQTEDDCQKPSRTTAQVTQKSSQDSMDKKQIAMAKIQENNKNKTEMINKEEDEETPSMYKKREITSNWDRYKEEPPDATDEIISKRANFSELAKVGGSSESYFLFQEEKEGDDWDCSLAIDCSSIADSLKHIPIYEQLDIPLDLVPPEELRATASHLPSASSPSSLVPYYYYVNLVEPSERVDAPPSTVPDPSRLESCLLYNETDATEKLHSSAFQEKLFELFEESDEEPSGCTVEDPVETALETEKEVPKESAHPITAPSFTLPLKPVTLPFKVSSLVSNPGAVAKKPAFDQTKPCLEDSELDDLLNLTANISLKNKDDKGSALPSLLDDWLNNTPKK